MFDIWSYLEWPQKYRTCIIGGQPPSLLIVVSGTVVHGKNTQANSSAPPSKVIDDQPRVFSQTFMLVPDPDATKTAAGEVAKYYITADTYRFVG